MALFIVCFQYTDEIKLCLACLSVSHAGTCVQILRQTANFGEIFARCARLQILNQIFENPCLRAKAPRVLRAVQAHTPTSRQSGDVNSNMLFTASAVRSTCGSGGSPHAGSKNDRQRQYRSDRSETAVRAVGRDPGAAHVFHEPYLPYSTTTITSVEGRECAMVPRNPPRPTDPLPRCLLALFSRLGG